MSKRIARDYSTKPGETIMLRPSLIAILPIAMFAKFNNENPVFTSLLPETQTKYHQPTITTTRITTQATLIAQGAAQIAQTTANCASHPNNCTNLAEQTLSATKKLADSAFTLVSATTTQNNKSVQSANEVANYAVKLHNIVKQAAANPSQATSFAAKISLAAARTAQAAAKTAQSLAALTNNTLDTNDLTNTTNQTIAQTAAQTAQIAANVAQYASNSAQASIVNGLNPTQVAQVRAIATQTIAQNPSLIAKTLTSQSSSYASNIEANTIVKARRSDIFSENNQLVLGNPNGDITIVEFNDYNCTYCKQMTATLNEATRQDPNLKIMVKETPVISPESTFAAKAAVAAKRQGQYASFRQLMNSTTQPTTPSILAQAAQALGLNQAAFQADINNPAITQYLAKNVELARSLGVDTTPTIIVSKNNGQFNKVVSGSLSLPELQALIASVRSARVSS